VWAVQCYDRQTGNVSIKHGVWQDKPVCNFGEASEPTEKKKCSDVERRNMAA